jgi:Holliday junction resolvase RusA-like endonuclease
LEIEFEFLEPPRGKVRPRLCYRNGKSIAFTPKNTRMYEKRLGVFAYEVMREKHLERFSGKTPLECELQAFYPIPKSENKATKQKNAIRCNSSCAYTGL